MRVVVSFVKGKDVLGGGVRSFKCIHKKLLPNCDKVMLNTYMAGGKYTNRYEDSHVHGEEYHRLAN